MIGNILRSYGLEIILCSDGKELLSKVKENNGSIDLVLTDHNMPYFTGIEVAQMIRELGYQFPICLMTGQEIVDVEPEGDKAGITGYLHKPFGIFELDNLIPNLKPAD